MRQGGEFNIGLGWFRKKSNTLDNLFSNYESDCSYYNNVSDLGDYELEFNHPLSLSSLNDVGSYRALRNASSRSCNPSCTACNLMVESLGCMALIDADKLALQYTSRDSIRPGKYRSTGNHSRVWTGSCCATTSTLLLRRRRRSRVYCFT